MIEFKNVNEANPPAPTLLRELDSLSREKDPEIFYSDLLRLGRRFQDRDRLDWAVKLYATVASQTEFPELAKKAQSSIAALEGRGPTGARAELLVTRFRKDASDPAMILPMLAGTTVAGLVRSAGLSALAAKPAAWYSRSWGARLGAGSLAFAAEVPTFVAVGRGLRGSPHAGSWSHDLSSAGLSLGAIKLFGLAGKQGLAQLHGVNEFGTMTRGLGLARYSHPFVHQASLFGGLMAAHSVETKLGLRPDVDDATAITDTLASMISLGAGMRLGTGLLGQGYARQMRELEWRTRTAPRALDLAAFQVPKISAKAMGLSAGLAMTLGAREAWAGGEILQMSSELEALIGIILSGGAGIGLRLLAALISARGKSPDRLIDPTAETLAMLKMLEQAPTSSPQELNKAAAYAYGFIEYRIPRKPEETQKALVAIELLTAILPKLRAGSTFTYMNALLRIIQNEGLEFQPASIRAFKSGMPSLAIPERVKLLDAIFKFLAAATHRNLLPGYFMALEVASGLDVRRRREAANRLSHHLTLNKKLVDGVSVQLRKKHAPFVLFRDFVLAVEETSAKGLFHHSVKGLPENPAEFSTQDFLRLFRAGVADPRTSDFDPKAAMTEIQILQELLGNIQPDPFAGKPVERPLWETLRQPSLQEYVAGSDEYFDSFKATGLRDRIVDRLLSQAGYRDPWTPPED